MSEQKNRSNDEIQQQVEEIISAGALGKSDAYARLLRFLAERAHTQKSVKEIEIAVEVFGRDETFDVTQDSLVRVYIHKLRTKLDNFYNNSDKHYSLRLTIPKGSYLLGLETNEAAPQTSPDKLSGLANRERTLLVGISLLAGILLTLSTIYLKSKAEMDTQPLQAEIWAPLAQNEKPLLVILGDIFVFSEVTSEFEQLREIRDFSIANYQDFLQRQTQDSDFMEHYSDFGVRYLPKAAGLSLKHLARFLGPESNWTLGLSSEMENTDLEQYNILYLGYFSALNLFKTDVFSQSVLQLHPNGNLLIQSETGEVFVGDGQLYPGYRDRYLDYAMLRKITLPSGNTLFALMSARDAGLESLVEYAFSSEGTGEIETQLGNSSADFEMLLEVSGSEPGNLISQIRMIRPTED